ncbi:MAG: hypothetical protein HY782_09560 [Chloroflexi bacterium]|nr:hypothetical protein [Chloroflexota bacterium]
MNAKHISRRNFLQSLAGLLLGGAIAALFPQAARADVPSDLEFFKAVKDPKAPTPIEKEHAIDIRLPIIAEDGANVPIVVSMNHPMAPDHYIKSMQIVNFNDPVVGKGVYYFTPASGQAFISTQIRMDGGDAEVYVIAECNQHGKWVNSKQLKVSLGGC